MILIDASDKLYLDRFNSIIPLIFLNLLGIKYVLVQIFSQYFENDLINHLNSFLPNFVDAKNLIIFHSYCAGISGKYIPCCIVMEPYKDKEDLLKLFDRLISLKVFL